MKQIVRILISAALLAALSTSAGAELSQQLWVQDAGGTRIQQTSQPGQDGPVEAPLPHELIWQHNIAGNIYSSCAALEAFDVFAGSTNGASCPANYFGELSGGSPTWTFTGGPNYVHGRGGLLALSEEAPAINGQRLHVFEAGNPMVELWSKEVANVSLSNSCLRVSEDGGVVAVAYNTSTNCTVYALDAATGDLISTFDTPAGQYVRALRLTYDGARIVVRAGATLHAIDTASGTGFWSGNVGASADPLGLSPDGHWLASGWSVFYVYEWDGSTYQPSWSRSGAGWYLGTCAVADNGALIAGWYTTSYNRNKIHWFDAAAGNTPVWEHIFPPSGGGYQDLPVSSAIDGYAAVVGSWGDEDGTNPEINAFTQDGPDPIFSVNTSGSIYEVDMMGYAVPGMRWPDTFTACGKHVHANEFGSGGDLYFGDLQVPTAAPETPAAALALSAYPNPFNPHSTLTLTLEQAGPARIALYDAAGRRVRVLLDGPCAAGENTAVWDGRDDAGRPVASGVYLARASAEGNLALRRLVLLR